MPATATTVVTSAPEDKHNGLGRSKCSIRDGERAESTGTIGGGAPVEAPETSPEHGEQSRVQGEQPIKPGLNTFD